MPDQQAVVRFAVHGADDQAGTGLVDQDEVVVPATVDAAAPGADGEGAAVAAGQRLFRIAALDRVWIEAEVYERDLAHVKKGTAVEVTLAALPGQAKLAANWVLGELASALNTEQLDIAQSRVDAAALAGLLARVVDNTISGKIAKEVFAAMWAGDGSADAIIDQRGLRQITDDGALAAAIDAVLAQYPEQIAKYRGGDEKIFQFLIGQLMKATKGKANPAQLNALLKAKLAP